MRIGSEDEALANACVVPPGGTANFSAFSPNQWGANSGCGFFFGNASNSSCTGVDANGDAQKIVYISPVFAGFQLTASYTPNESVESHTNGGGPHAGMPGHGFGQSRHNMSVYLNYACTGDGWGLNADRKEQDFYQAGINLTFGNFVAWSRRSRRSITPATRRSAAAEFKPAVLRRSYVEPPFVASPICATRQWRCTERPLK